MQSNIRQTSENKINKDGYNHRSKSRSSGNDAGTLS